MKRCRKGHTYSPDENYRSRSGRCPQCQREADRRYNASPKGYRRRERYEQTASAIRRKIAYDQLDGHDTYLQEDRLEEREAYEASGSALPFVDWLIKERPLRAFRGL